MTVLCAYLYQYHHHHSPLSGTAQGQLTTDRQWGRSAVRPVPPLSPDCHGYGCSSSQQPHTLDYHSIRYKICSDSPSQRGQEVNAVKDVGITSHKIIV